MNEVCLLREEQHAEVCVEVVKSFGNFVITVNGSDHCLSNIEYKEVTYSTIFYFTTTSSEYRKKESPEKAIPLSLINHVFFRLPSTPAQSYEKSPPQTPPICKY